MSFLGISEVRCAYVVRDAARPHFAPCRELEADVLSSLLPAVKKDVPTFQSRRNQRSALSEAAAKVEAKAPNQAEVA